MPEALMRRYGEYRSGSTPASFPLMPCAEAEAFDAWT